MIEQEQLIGGWRLESWRVEPGRAPPAAAPARAGAPFGDDAEGLLLYGPDGWMTATMYARQRTPLSHPSARRATLESRAAALDEYLSYGGRWRLEGDCIHHEILFSLNPILIGTKQVREARLEGAVLELLARESDGGRERQHRIRWQRAAAR